MQGELTSDWTVHYAITPESSTRWESWPSVTVLLECADYRTPDGFEHREGAWRVRSFYTSGRSHKRTRQWRGETAWMNARREYSDRVAELRFGQ